MINRLKAQSSIEFITMVGIGMALSAPFIIVVQENAVQLQEGTENSRFSSSLNQLVNAVERSEALGKQAEVEFTLRLPNYVERSYIDGKFLVIEQNSSEGSQNITRVFEVNKSITGDIPEEQGDFTGKARNTGSQIVLEFPNVDS